MEKFNRCTSNEFKKDISELCDQCPIPDEIQKWLKLQIIPRIETQKQILTITQFQEFIQKEINSAQQAMDQAFRSGTKDVMDRFGAARRVNNIKAFIWNKERIKVLNLFLEAVPLTSNMPAKYYALYHWILIEMGVEYDFERNENDKYIKSKIEAIAKERYPNTRPQGFYRAFKDIDITNKLAIANTFGRGYKEKIIELSNNDAKVIFHLKNFPN